MTVFTPKIISKVDKRILLAPFAKGGRVVGYTELERTYRKFIRQEFSL